VVKSALTQQAPAKGEAAEAVKPVENTPKDIPN
jgi:preprotein translocase subunit SecG